MIRYYIVAALVLASIVCADAKLHYRAEEKPDPGK